MAKIKVYGIHARHYPARRGATTWYSFQCDWSSNFWKNGLEDLVWTMNFGTGANIAEQVQKLKEMRPEASAYVLGVLERMV